jgi:hypothetical protein
MSEHDERSAELAAAAASGAAAAVDAVHEEHTEEDHDEAREAAVSLSTEAADEAASEAMVAASSAEDAAQAASVAVEESQQAEAAATTAVVEATEARSEVAELREYIEAQNNALRGFLEERLAPRESSDQPTEVVVTHAEQQSSRDNSGTEQGTNAGSGESVEGTGATHRRHRFGRRTA